MAEHARQATDLPEAEARPERDGVGVGGDDQIELHRGKCPAPGRSRRSAGPWRGRCPAPAPRDAWRRRRWRRGRRGRAGWRGRSSCPAPRPRSPRRRHGGPGRTSRRAPAPRPSPAAGRRHPPRAGSAPGSTRSRRGHGFAPGGSGGRSSGPRKGPVQGGRAEGPCRRPLQRCRSPATVTALVTRIDRRRAPGWERWDLSAQTPDPFGRTSARAETKRLSRRGKTSKNSPLARLLPGVDGRIFPD
ncbi:hypothetical protein M2437_002648 [Methylorubrum pseudosasae]|nr:hypothetical protein [Methylorubrum pseudosasae]